MMGIRGFIDRHFKHFNSAALRDAAIAYDSHINSGGKMMITLAGAMSTAELGISLAQMIREDKCHIICCTGANLEEDLMNLVANTSYERIDNWRDLTPEDDFELYKRGFNRVTDTCIPEDLAFRKIQSVIEKYWNISNINGIPLFPHEYIYLILENGDLSQDYCIDIKDSWLYAAYEKNIPIIVPGWEDSTLGNIFASNVISGKLKSRNVKNGIDYMVFLADWYRKNSNFNIGIFQIGGGIAGDFPICVVPMLHQDLQLENIGVWRYFCQISDSTSSYGSYSGALPNEKITWGKLDIDTPKFVIESDATIVAPLIFGYILGE